jgi:ABC-type Zn2+ transport system substrate-binding protein/surface adhesin
MLNRSLFNLRTSRKFITSNLFKLKASNFSSGHAHGNDAHHDGGDHGDHGHGHDDHHHHVITGDVDLNRVYVPLNGKVIHIKLN